MGIFAAFSLALSLCDKKNASLVNRRYATPERIEQIKEAQRAKARGEERSAHVVVDGTQPAQDDEVPPPMSSSTSLSSSSSSSSSSPSSSSSSPKEKAMRRL
ncbi:hypothetical protein AGMMS49593_00440 [Endomicrobiia bacterium]|nr:hypothetical protein AGMMS49593_00440 [Endomicrobiia bacterium]